MSAKTTSWWRRRLRSAGRERGMVEAGIAAAGGLLVVGAVVGNGVAASVMDMSDGQTWLPENDGSVVQINPATGQPEYRLVVGDDGERMEVTQSDGFLVVTNLDTGVVTPIDLTGLLVGQGRQTEGETVVMIGGGLMVLAELEPGLVQVIDPFTAASMGSPYRAGEDLSDVVIDRDGTVWLVTDSGNLRELDWVASAGEFSVSLERPIAAAGPGTRLVPHDSGVTVFAPDGGAVLQIGVGGDIVQQVPALQGEVLAAATSPADLAPASASDLGLVLMISGRELRTVDVGMMDCAQPLAPAVFERRVYVPCGGQGRVIVLDENGFSAGPDILVPGGGDPSLVVDDGRLIVHDPDDGRIVLVQQDGSSQVTDLAGTEVPTVEPDEQQPLPPISVTDPTPPVTPPTQEPIEILPPGNPPTDDPTDRPTDGPTNGPTDDPTDQPTDDPSNDPSDGPSTDGGDDTGPADADLAPTGVIATVDGDAVRVSWQPPVEPQSGYLVTSSDGAASQWLGAEETETSVTGLTCGTTVTLTVYAQHAGDRMVGATADVDTPACVNPPEPGQLTPSDVVAQRADDDVVVGWTAPEIAPERYVVVGMGLTRTVDGTATSTVFADVPCGDPIRFDVTAVHPEAGEYSAGSATVTETCPVDPADLQPRNVTLTRVSGNSYQLTWQSPAVAPTGYVVTGSGVDQTLGAGATSLDVTIPCVETVRLTVTANHADGTTSGVLSNQLTNTCTTTTTPPPSPTTTLTAPTNVTASRVDVDTVRVTWSDSSPGAEEYVVIPSSGGSVSTSGTSADVDVTPGSAYTFRVEARWQGQTALSGTSNSVNMPAPATVPDGPGNLQASTNQSPPFVTNTVTWTAPGDGGSPLTGYQLVWDGRVIALGPGQTSWSETVDCTPCSQVIEVPEFDVTLRAQNAIGWGLTAVTIPTAGGTPAIPVPEDGDPVLTDSSGVDTSNPDQQTSWARIGYVPTSPWTSVGGTCTAQVDGQAPVTFSCSQPQQWQRQAALHVGAMISVTVTITWPGGSATSSQTAMGPAQAWCNSEGICYQIVGLPVDPDVDVDPLPWTPPEVPNPPVLVAGIGMLLGAGTMKTLRELRRRGLIETPATTTERPKDTDR